jgi:hypothetical protein
MILRRSSSIEALAKANVAAIGFDVLFSEKDPPSDDLKACARAPIAPTCQEQADGDLAFAHAISHPTAFCMGGDPCWEGR